MCETCACKPLARSKAYQFLSAAFGYPDKALLELLRSSLLDTENCLLLLADGPTLETFRALGLAVPSAPEKLESEYLQTFGHTLSRECPPCEAEYGQAHIFQKSQALADIAGFYRAFGLELASSFKDRLDHVSVELEFLHFLCLKEAYALVNGHSEEHLALCREAYVKFLQEHLGQWALEFTRRLEERAGGRWYGLLGRLLGAFLTFEMQRLNLTPVKVDGPVSVEPEEAPGCETCPLFELPTIGRGG